MARRETEYIAARVDRGLADRLRIIAANEDRSLSKQIERLLTAAVAQIQRQYEVDNAG